MSILDELRNIEIREGTLKPESVVKYARNPRTALHKQFEWNDTEAARKFRLHQARMLIRVMVTVIPGSGETTRAFVSLKEDRTSGEGYRNIVSVLSDADMKERLIFEALEDARTFRRKYNALKELASIFDAMDEVEEKQLCKMSAA